LHQRLQQFFESTGLPAQVVCAQGATSLIALARLRLAQLQPCGLKSRVADLPMHTLTAARAHQDVLERMGCRSWDDLLRLPRDGVARRFGAPLLEALDRARGALPDGYTWLTLPECFDEKRELNALVSHAPALMAELEPLLLQLQAWLVGRQSAISALKLVWHLDPRRDTAASLESVVRTAQPAQDLHHVTRLIAEQLARLSLPAPVFSITLASLQIQPLVDADAATGSLLLQASQQGDGALELIERLSARLGADQVRLWQPNADHRPELMQRWVNAQGHATGRRLANAAAVKTEALYPTWLLEPPLKLAVLAGHPVYQGPLQRLAGPQRLEACGWLVAEPAAAPGADAQASEKGQLAALRDYFVYRSQQAGLLWIYNERLGASAHTQHQGQAQQAWYLHGFFA